MFLEWQWSSQLYGKWPLYLNSPQADIYYNIPLTVGYIPILEKFKYKRVFSEPTKYGKFQALSFIQYLLYAVMQQTLLGIGL